MRFSYKMIKRLDRIQKRLQAIHDDTKVDTDIRTAVGECLKPIKRAKSRAHEIYLQEVRN